MQQVVRIGGGSEHVSFGAAGAAQFERTDTFSISFWFRSRFPASALRSIVSSRVALTGWDCRLSNGSGAVSVGEIDFILFDTNASQFRRVYVPGRADDQLWHHVIITSDGVDAAGMSIYYDGAEVSAVDLDNLTSASTVDGAAVLRCGGYVGDNQPYDGDICQVAIWDKELSAAEAEEAWQGGRVVDLATHSAYANVVIYARVLSDTYPTLIDAKGTANGTMSGMSSRDLVDDQPPVCALSTVFDGTADYAAVAGSAAHNYERTDTFSVSTWLRSTNASSGQIVGKMDHTAPFTGWSLWMTGAGVLRFDLTNTSGSNEIELQSDDPYNDGEWHHVSATYDGSSSASGVLLYIDGVAIGTNAISDTLSASIQSSAVLTVGARQGPVAWFWEGLQVELAVYDKTLTPAEVSTIYGAGTPPHLRGASMPSNLVGYWKLGMWDVFAVLRDTSTNTNDLTTVSMSAGSLVANYPPAIRSSVASGSYLFREGTSSVSIPNAGGLTFDESAAFSVVVWVKFTRGSGIMTVLSNISVTSPGFDFRVDSDTGAVSIYLNSTSGSILIDSVADHPVLYGHWYHLAVTYDGSSSAAGMKMYVNGMPHLPSVASDTLSGTTANSNPTILGVRAGVSQDFDGKLGDVRVYSKVLTQEELRGLYNNRLSTSPLPDLSSGWLDGWYGMGQDSDDTVDVVLDRSPYKRDGTAVGFSDRESILSDTPTPYGVPLEPAFFDGKVQWVAVDDDAAELKFERTDTFSVSFWFTSASSDEGVFIGNLDSTQNFQGWQIRSLPGGELQVELINTAGSNLIQVDTSGVDVLDTQLHQVVVTYSGSSAASGLVVYVDGVAQSVSVNSDTLSASINNVNTRTVHIGHRPDVGYFGADMLSGNMHTTAIYDKVLNQAEVTSLYGGGVGQDHTFKGPVDNLLSFFPLDLVAELQLGNTTTNDLFLACNCAGTYIRSAQGTGMQFTHGDVAEVELIDIGEDVGSGVEISYFMRGIADPGPGYEYWTVVGAPDPAGVGSPGAIVADSGIVAGRWGADEVTLPV